MTKQQCPAMMTRHSALVVRRMVAGVMIVLLLLQLFAFERVVVTPGVPMMWMIALVLVELGALPFLLGIQGLSRVLRVTSALCGLLSIGLMLGVESLAFANRQTVVAGAVLELPAGTWSLWFIMGLAVLVLWGLVPSCRERLARRQSHDTKRPARKRK
ncbi:MAG: hypothetical protein Q4A34_03000 [Candidatus Saccharibacteria bacterium]|nr:hypothetical protein [Candidatus Saccharibacteria bacterium]